jgi:hypothetical protein
MRNKLIYIPLILVFIVQAFDKEHKFFFTQILLLTSTIIIVIYLKISKRDK